MAERRRRGGEAANRRRDGGAGGASATKGRSRTKDVPEDLVDDSAVADSVVDDEILDEDVEVDEIDIDEDADVEVDEDADVEVDEDADVEVDEDADEDEPKSRRNGRGTATKTRPKSSAPGKKSTRVGAADRPNIFGRLVNFVREVVAELRKVIWPTRSELLTYTAVVVVFVSIILAIVGGLDFGFAKAVLWVFGAKTTSQ